MALGAAQRKLAEEHLGLVRALALKACQGLPPQIEVDELVSCGTEGLMEAAERFNPTAGASFKTFAYYRINGAIYDGLRRMGWLSRKEYAKHRAAERVNQYLQSGADRESAAQSVGPGGSAGAAVPRKSLEDELSAIGEALDGVATIFITSLEGLGLDHGRTQLPSDDEPVPAQFEVHEKRAGVRAAVARLPEKERQLMELYYFEERTLEEAGKALGLSKSWACRLHARAVDLLRETLEPPADEG
jgi:RNA polymerase sigma factor for flagellar operon FliA